MDEISCGAEMESVKAGLNSGVSFVVTAHANSVEDLEKRGIYYDFAQIIISLSGVGEIGKVVKNESRSYFSDMADVRSYGLL